MDLVQKTRFEKQIPFPILAEIADEIKRMDECGLKIDIPDQVDSIKYLVRALEMEIKDFPARQVLIVLAADAIRTIKLLDKRT